MTPQPSKTRRTDKPKERRDTGGRFAVLNRFVDMSLSQVTSAAALVWLVLFRDTKPDGLVKTSQADIARRAGLSLKTAKRAVKALDKAGLLTRVYRGSLRRGPSVYRVHPLIRQA